MGGFLGKPKWAPIKQIHNSGLCYLTYPPSYSPNVVYFEDGTDEIYSDEEIIAELRRQKKLYLWKRRYQDQKEYETLQAFEKHIERMESKISSSSLVIKS